ncbi:ABC transporter ATP-binding protein [Lactiplantibacillus plantarum]|nr:ABC transporter ATP-binding protein [Lactiplantibacillus plantarum]RRG00988.1 MAG: ABC transporter ATP-binding protein [Lactobacillus sp.]MCT4468585.1 ABC transporter ATP-binding protein [Lactiplantibacillus plantarum]PTS37288.1 ABC transporter ATP-binding protein [Lactiplantibacillus plantarum]PTV11843.1 ABC transporter ATP-binding protein [Lactiplantibacillus plantarum]
MVNTILKEADLFCPNSVRINFTIYHLFSGILNLNNSCQNQYRH